MVFRFPFCLETFRKRSNLLDFVQFYSICLFISSKKAKFAPVINTLPTLKRFSILTLLLVLLTACHKPSEPLANSDHASGVQVSTELSNQRIHAIVEDQRGYIWIATYRGLNRYDGYQMHQYFCNDQPDGLPDNQVRNLYVDTRGRLWVVTKAGVALYTEMDGFETVPVPDRSLLSRAIVENSRGEIFLLQSTQVQRYDSVADAFVPHLKDIPVTSYADNQLLVDAEDNLWVVTSQGAYCYSTITGRHVLTLEMPGQSLSKACIIGSHLWIGYGEQGIRIYNIGERRWEDPDSVMSRDARLSQSSVMSIYHIPSPNVVLIGTSLGMFEYRLDSHELFHQSDAGFTFNAPDFNVEHFLYDRSHNLWFCSSVKGFVVHSNSERTFNADNYLRSTFSDVPVASVSLQDERMLWIATQFHGLWNYDLVTHQLHSFSMEYLSQFLDEDNFSIYFSFVDSQGNLWLSCVPFTVLCVRPEGKELRLVGKYAMNFPIVITETSDHTICVGSYGNNYYTKRAGDDYFEEHRILTNSNTYMANLLPLKDGRTAALVKDQALRMFTPGRTELGPQVIPDSVIATCIQRSVFLPTSLHQDDEGGLWMGTVSNGLMHYDLTTGSLEAIPDAPCEDIASIEQDRHGKLWVSTQHGLGCYNLKSRTFINYYKSDGLNGNEFYDRCSCVLPDGRLVFGGEHGLTIFDPDRIEGDIEPLLNFEDLRVHNQLVRPAADGPITSHLSTAPSIRLKHDQNNFSISYSALDFGEGLRFCYQYKLEGFHQQWVNASESNVAFLSNIPDGDYRFVVRVMSRDQQRILAERSIPVIVQPAPWLTWWAKLLYALVGLAIIWYIFSAWRRIRQERWNRLQTERDKEREKRINAMNMSFFANVSHEFRTPLTIILAPIRQLVSDKRLPAESHGMLVIMQRSVERMLRLVNQMMDFHKLEDDALQLEVQHLDIVSLLHDVLETFTLQAREKDITLDSHGLEEPFMQWVDIDKVEKIVYNLVGNALKYTPSGGHITLDFDVITRQEAIDRMPQAADLQCERVVEIRVTDDGPGLPEKELGKIFERYFQLARQQSGAFSWGTGIGLYYSRRLVELHKGLINAANRTDGTTGAVFTMLLPVDDQCYTDVKHIDQPQSQSALFPLSSRSEEEQSDVAAGDGMTDDARPSILVVDDDVEIVRYLKALLGQQYNVRACFDVDSALDSISQQEPDMILSDVMMPGKDGYELCREVKDSIQLCHIPVVLVTAKTTTSDQIEGLDSGADAYVSKPFDPAYLLTLIANILTNREKVRHLLTANTQTTSLAENVLSPQDKAFMTEFYAIMEKELSNPDLDINHITEIMHVSRSKFYYKVKGLTGEKPGNFFRLFKLNRAAELLREGKYNVSEIADITGFSSLSYFSASFKKQFGVAPSEYT